jgi:hypothetical protein
MRELSHQVQDDHFRYLGNDSNYRQPASMDSALALMGICASWFSPSFAQHLKQCIDSKKHRDACCKFEYHYQFLMAHFIFCCSGSPAEMVTGGVGSSR